MTQPRSSILEKSIRIIGTLVRSPSPLRVSTIAKMTQYNRSSVHRILAMLNAMNVVQYDEVTGQYGVGSVMLDWTHNLINRTDLQAVADPLMRNLSRMSSENVLLAIRDRNELIYINRVESVASIRVFARVGGRASLHCTAVGKCLVAFLDKEERDELLPNISWTKFTENTITNRVVFEDEIATIRVNGYAVDNQEHQNMVHCLAAPVWNLGNKVAAAISITAPIFRVPREKLLGWSDQVMATAAEISAKLGSREARYDAID